MARKACRTSIREVKDPPGPLTIFESIKDRPYSFFLDSACDPAKLGRFSFLGSDPFLVFRSKGDRITIERPGARIENITSDPFLAIRRLLDEYRGSGSLTDIPFTGGAVGYLSYDMKSFIEDLPDNAKDDIDLPDSMLGFYNSVVIYDHLHKRCYVSDSGAAKSRSAEVVRSIKSLSRRRDNAKRYESARCAHAELESNFSAHEYARAVMRAKEYIKSGDIYQVNISQRFHAKISEDTFELYSRLRKVSPAPFASCLNFNEVTVLSSSPERFIMKRGDRIETRPIKGTRPRGADPESDLELAEELKNSAKDMAEHIMIVDLERNDLGRICRYGSVRLTESAIIERYSSVHHLVSTVSGTLKSGIDAVDCLKSTFPGGSITGAPKIRSIGIIDELENVKRSIYTGAIGYIGFDGNMDTSIVIRTFIVKGTDIYFQVGGGIVADSEPDKEYEETLHKAAGLMRALGCGSLKAPQRPKAAAGRKVCV